MGRFLREATGDGRERRQRLSAEGAQQLAGGGGHVAREMRHARLLRKHGIGAERLAQALDGGGGDNRGDRAALGMPIRVVAQERLLEGCRQIGVGIAKQAGEIVSGPRWLAPTEQADDLHARMNTLDRPLNVLGTTDLVPGSKALDKINASLR